LRNIESRPDFISSSKNFKTLLAAPYIKEKPLSLRVTKEGETLTINEMNPLTGNKLGI
jgi:hypothetical protein